VLTGGPGCGKSFTVRSVVELARAKTARVVLAAPTGRAAKRLAALTGHDASTVHRLLELQPGGDPRYDRDNPSTPTSSSTTKRPCSTSSSPTSSSKPSRPARTCPSRARGASNAQTDEPPPSVTAVTNSWGARPASVAIQISGTFGSRQEEAQRLGRLLRPKGDGRQAHFYSIVSRDTEYAAHRQRFLAEQGYAYHIVDADDLLRPL